MIVKRRCNNCEYGQWDSREMLKCKGCINFKNYKPIKKEENK